MQDLEPLFHQEMLRVYDEASAIGYRPTRFLQMVQRMGGLETAKTFLDQDAPTDGFTKLWELNKLDLSVEAVALHPKYQPLFSHDQLIKARKRLAEYGYQQDNQI